MQPAASCIRETLTPAASWTEVHHKYDGLGVRPRLRLYLLAWGAAHLKRTFFLQASGVARPHDRWGRQWLARRAGFRAGLVIGTCGRDQAGSTCAEPALNNQVGCFVPATTLRPPWSPLST